MTREQFDALRAPEGALVVGSPHEVVEKILQQHEIFGHDRFLAQMSVGTMAHRDVMRALELLGTEVAPAVRAQVARSARCRPGSRPEPVPLRSGKQVGIAAVWRVDEWS